MEAQTQILDEERINEIIEKIAKEKIGTKTVPPYNVFSMWNMSENDHTKILLALMRYKESNESYPLIYSFLERFAKGCIAKDEFHETKIEFNAFFPNIEVDNIKKDSLIDGLITFKSNNIDKAVIIENKIFDASDQKGQIRRYINAIKIEKKIDLNNIWVFYITSDGSKVVEEKSYKKDKENENYNIGDNFVELNYQNDITAWLKEKVLDARKYPEALTSVVRAYVESLEKDLFNENFFEKINYEDYTFLKGNFDKLYEVYVDSSKKRSESRNNYAEGKTEKEKYEETENKYYVAKKLVQVIEKDAFEAFKKCSVEILNEIWKNKLGDDFKWIVKHRSIIGNKGFIQIRLDDGWEGGHLEWHPISASKMYKGGEYQLCFHVEKDDNLRNYMCKKPGIETPKIKFTIPVKNNKTIAEMPVEELKNFLKMFYENETVKNYCSCLIDYYNQRAPGTETQQETDTTQHVAI